MHYIPLAITALAWPIASSAHALDRRASTSTASHYLPVPSSAIGPAIPSVGYLVEDLGAGAFMVTEGVYQAMFLVSDKGVVLVDAPPTIGYSVLYAVGNTTAKPITHLVYSHSHADHIGAAYLIKNQYPNVTIIAHGDTRELLQYPFDDHRPLPDVVFQDCHPLKVGHQTLELTYKGENHIKGNIFIYVEKQKTLMVVDIVYPGWTPYDSLAESKNIPGWYKAHDQILEYDFEQYLGGHLNRPGSRKEVMAQRAFIHDLFDNCAETIRLTATNDPVLGNAATFGTAEAVNPNNPWAAQQAWYDATVSHCVNLTNAKWATRLAGSDVFNPSNAKTLLESLRIDWGILGGSGVM